MKFDNGTGHMSEAEASNYWNQLQSSSSTQGNPRPSQQQIGSEPVQTNQPAYYPNQSEGFVEEIVKRNSTFVLKRFLSCCTIM